MALDNSDIPEWLLWELLIRLPLKSVVMFKLLSKQWASFISNPSFVRSYLSHHQSSSSRSWTVIGQRMINHSGNHLTFIELNLRKDICSRKCSFGSLCLPNIHGGECYKVFGASNGLVLFGLIKYSAGNFYYMCNIYYLCNPVTGESIRLPPLPRTAQKFTTYDHRLWGPALVARVDENAILESYRVVLLLPRKEGEYMRAMVYASETQEWKEYVLPCEIPSWHFFNAPTTLNNQILHWGATYGSAIAYDPYASPDQIRIIAPLPQYAPMGVVFYRRMCNASRGKLRYLEKLTLIDHKKQARSVRFKLWVLEEDTWCLAHESDDTGVRFDGVGVEALELLKDLDSMFFDPYDADVLYLKGLRRLVSYDFKTGNAKVVEEYVTHEECSGNEAFPPRPDFFLVELSPWPISINNMPPCPPSAPVSLIMRGVRSLCDKFLDYFF